MNINISLSEAKVLIELKEFIDKSATPPDDFMLWIRDRLISYHNTSERTDYVQKLYDYHKLFTRLQKLLEE